MGNPTSAWTPVQEAPAGWTPVNEQPAQAAPVQQQPEMQAKIDALRKQNALNGGLDQKAAEQVPGYWEIASSPKFLGGRMDMLGEKVGSFTSNFAENMGAPPQLSDYLSGPSYAAQHPIDSARLVAGAAYDAHSNMANDAWNQMKQPGWSNKIIGGLRYLESGIPLVGPALDAAGRKMQGGDIAGGLGATAGIATSLYGPKEIPKVIEATATKVKPTLANMKPTEAIASVFEGKQSAVMPAETANLPLKAISGAEDIFRAAAPTGNNRNFRANLYAAAGDLAEIGQKVDLKEASGGIRNPDMRVRATVDAINDHLQQMYHEERAPQISRHAQERVPVTLGPDALEGLNYLKRSAGESMVRDIATKAIQEGELSLADADRLAIVANQELKGFESMTAAERMAASMTNRRLQGVKSLDRGLSRVINNSLEANGETGLFSYERRYAALAEVSNALSKRMNAVELQQPGVMKAVVGPLVRSVSGPKQAITSASQAAVADVNIGRTLQRGFQKLAESGVKAKR